MSPAVSPAESPRRALVSALRVAVLIAAAAPRVWAAFADQGLFWPDEFYQSTEQAHRFAFGYGIVPWEFVEGLRSWVYPGAIGILWKAMAAAGVTRSSTLIIAAKLVMVVGSVIAVDLAMRFARRRAGDAAGILAGTLVAAYPALVFFASKCMTETASVPLVMAAAWLTCASDGREPVAMLAREPGWWRAGAAGALAAASIYLRYQNGLIAVAFLVMLAAQRRFRDAVHYAIAAFVVGMAGGVLDRFTWGGFFHSFIGYATFHAEGGAVSWGSERADYFVVATWRTCGVAILPILAGFVVGSGRAPGYAAIAILVVVVHSLVPHKEYRFITPIIPLALAISAIGLADIAAWARRRWSRRAARPGAADDAEAETAAVRREGRVVGAALLVTAAVMAGAFAYDTATMTFRDLGHGDGLAAKLAGPDDSPWHAAEGINRMLWAAGEAPDVCGVVIQEIPWSSTGGFAYLHRDVPMLFHFDSRAAKVANYLIARRGDYTARNYKQVDETRDFALFRRDGPCAPPPASYTRIVPP